MSEFGTELKRRRLSVGMSLTALATAIHFTKGYISKVENGKARVNRDLAAACDRALDAKGTLLAMITDVAEQPRRSAGGLVGLPDGTRHFVGRDTERAALSAMLLDQNAVRVCVVNGMAGAGKTALAVAVARAAAGDFPDGCLFFDLRGHTPGVAELTPADVLYRLLRLLDVPGDRIPADVDGRANLAQDTMRGRRMLLVFDNVRSARQVRLLLPGEPACRVIITSRGRLASLDDAWHVPVGMLAEADAMALFRSVAGHQVPDDEPAVADIVAHCGLLPLAIRIAAARFVAGGWSATRFRDRLADAATTLSALDDGERSVAAAFGVSYDALPGDERRLFGLLALHPGTPAESEVVAAMAGLDPGEADRLLDRLHDAHLVTRDATGYVAVHDLMRAFAVRCALPGIGTADRAGAAGRLVDRVLARLVAADEIVEPHRFRPVIEGLSPGELPFGDQAGALAWLHAQWPTLVEIIGLARRYERDQRCWQLAFVLRAFLFRERLLEPWISTHLDGLAGAEAAGDLSATGMILNNLGMAYLESGAAVTAIDCHQRARACFLESGDECGATDALSGLAWARLYAGEPEPALRDLGAVLAVYRQTGRTRNVVIALRGMAFALATLDRFPEALASAAEARRLAQLPVDVLMCVNCLAWVHFRDGRLDDAGRHYLAAADLAELARSDYERARAVTGLGNVAARRGDLAAAARWWSEASEYRVNLNPLVLGEAAARRELEPATPTGRHR